MGHGRSYARRRARCRSHACIARPSRRLSAGTGYLVGHSVLRALRVTERRSCRASCRKRGKASRNGGGVARQGGSQGASVDQEDVGPSREDASKVKQNERRCTCVRLCGSAHLRLPSAAVAWLALPRCCRVRSLVTRVTANMILASFLHALPFRTLHAISLAPPFSSAS
jgi:hypothetical protein